MYFPSRGKGSDCTGTARKVNAFLPAVTHFYASDEGHQKMADSAIDEILALNTLPAVRNRDEQGRLRRKMVVLKIEKWLARKLCEITDVADEPSENFYQIDMSSKNPRFRGKIWSNDQLASLRTG